MDFSRTVGFLTIQGVQIWSCTYCSRGFNDRSKSWNSILNMMLIIWQRSRDLFIINSSPYKHKSSQRCCSLPSIATDYICLLLFTLSSFIVLHFSRMWMMDGNGQCTRVWSVDFKTCGKTGNDISMDTPSEVSALTPQGDTPSSASFLARRLREAEMEHRACTPGVSASFHLASIQVWPMLPAWMCLLYSVHGNKDIFGSKDTHA